MNGGGDLVTAAPGTSGDTSQLRKRETSGVLADQVHHLNLTQMPNIALCS